MWETAALRAPQREQETKMKAMQKPSFMQNQIQRTGGDGWEAER